MTRSKPQASKQSTAARAARDRPPSSPRAENERMKTFGCAAFAPMRMRSPSTAPPLIGLDGSIAITATVRPAPSQAPSRASTSVDLPLPGTPVMPTTQAPAGALRAARAASRRPAPSSSISVSRRRERAPVAGRARASGEVARGGWSGHAQTMTSGWPKPRSRRRRAQISSLRQAGAGAVDDGAEDVAVAALGGAGEVVERLGDRAAERSAFDGGERVEVALHRRGVGPLDRAAGSPRRRRRGTC